MAGVSWQSSRRIQKVHGQPSSAFGAKALIVAGLIHFGISISNIFPETEAVMMVAVCL